MLLNEFLYFDKEGAEMRSNDRYDPSNDSSVIKLSDTRKSRLSLKMLNRLRLASDAREREQKEELELVQKMYKAPPAQGPGM